MIIQAELKCKQTGCEADPCAVDMRTTAKRPRLVRLPHLSVWHWMLTFTK